MSDYFEIANLEVPCAFILNNGSSFDMRLGMPSNSLEVYKTGFQFIGLKAGAEVLFQKEKASDLLYYIEKSRRIQDVEILAKAKLDNEKIQEAAKKRIEQLTLLL